MPGGSSTCVRLLVDHIKKAAVSGYRRSGHRPVGVGRKPGSVEDSHSSWAGVTARLQRPTREPRGPRDRSPIWPCSGWGLPCRRVLPPTRCALTAPFHRCRPSRDGLGGLLSAALSVGSRRPGITWHPALWSPDFPPPPHGRERLSHRLQRQFYHATRATKGARHRRWGIVGRYGGASWEDPAQPHTNHG